jgi:hypothetical protein
VTIVWSSERVTSLAYASSSRNVALSNCSILISTSSDSVCCQNKEEKEG